MVYLTQTERVPSGEAVVVVVLLQQKCAESRYHHMNIIDFKPFYELS